MKLTETKIKDLIFLTPNVYHDERGYFMESYNQNLFKTNDIINNFIQDNQAFSKKNVIRGLHLQVPPFSQSKLVRVIQGEILDVAVDLRPNSATYGQYHSEILSETNKKQLLIPKGFAHGYSVLSETSTVLYKCDEFYHPESELGLNPFDPAIGIDWKINQKDAILSEKDMENPGINDLDKELLFTV